MFGRGHIKLSIIAMYNYFKYNLISIISEINMRKYIRFLRKFRSLCFVVVVVVFTFLLFRATSTACGSSQARDQIRTTAAGLCQSPSRQDP